MYVSQHLLVGTCSYIHVLTVFEGCQSYRVHRVTKIEGCYAIWMSVKSAPIARLPA